MGGQNDKQTMTQFLQSVEFFTVEDAAERTGVGRHKISEWARTGQITAKIVGRQAVLPECAIDEIRAIAADWTGAEGGRKSGMYASVLRSDLDDYLPLADAAKLVERDAMTLRRWMTAGKLQGYRLGRHQVFCKRSDIDEIRANIAAGRGPFEAAKGAA